MMRVPVPFRKLHDKVFAAYDFYPVREFLYHEVLDLLPYNTSGSRTFGIIGTDAYFVIAYENCPCIFIQVI
jgi:hypothetical protein